MNKKPACVRLLMLLFAHATRIKLEQMPVSLRVQETNARSVLTWLCLCVTTVESETVNPANKVQPRWAGARTLPRWEEPSSYWAGFCLRVLPVPQQHNLSCWSCIQPFPKWVFFFTPFHSSCLSVWMKHPTHTLAAGAWRAIWRSQRLLSVQQGGHVTAEKNASDKEKKSDWMEKSKEERRWWRTR